MTMRLRLSSVALAAVFIAGGCGSRLDEQRLRAANGLPPGIVPAGQPPVVSAAHRQARAMDSGRPAEASGSADALRAVPTAPVDAAAPAPSPDKAGPRTTIDVPSRNIESREIGPAPGTTPGISPSRAAGPDAVKGSGADVVLGSFGVQTGVLGAVTRPAPAGVRAWAASLNSRGGLNGHRVRLVVGDDGGEPARTQVVVRQMVEQDHVVAFLNHFSFTLYAALPYLESKGVPIIGGTNASEDEDKSAIVFQPLLGADDGIAWSFLLAIAAQTPKKRIALVYCREVTQCENQRGKIKSKLPYAGLQFVYEAQVSLAQPDYTAEMLAAQRAGAEVVMGLLDTASLIRLARSAHRQGYQPILNGPHNLEADQTFTGGEELEGLLVPSRLPPYKSSPKMADYREAMAKYQPGEPLGGYGSGGFVVGKLLEKLAPVIGEPVTSQGLITALYTLRGERLDGLLPGVSFPRGPNRTQVNLCIVPSTVRGNTFVPHDAAETFVCAPDWKPEG